MFAMAWSTWAIRPLRIAAPMKQSDGTTVQVYKHGDQYCAYYTTLDGKVLYSNATGDLCYANLVNGELVPSNVIAHDPESRNQAEIEFVSRLDINHMTPAVTKLAKRHTPHKVIYASTADGLGKKGTSAMGSVKSIGKVKIPVILVSYANLDLQETSTKEKYDRYFNEPGYHDEPNTVGSVKDYFIAQSHGAFEPTFHIVGRVKLSRERAYYGANAGGQAGRDVRAKDMIIEAIRLVKAEGTDFSQFVVDGSIPNITVLYAGPGEAEYNAPAEAIWPHELDFEADIEGFHFKSYFVGNEISQGTGKIAGIGVFCHEFSHALGLPDFYPTDYSYTEDYAFGDWSIMEQGCNILNGNAPMGMMAYERSYLGWLEIPEINNEAKAITLDDINKKDGVPAVMIRNPYNNREYFILENRQPGTWYPESYGSGLMLTHFTYEKTQWQYNTLNNIKNKKRAHIITADNSQIKYTVGQNHFFGNGVNNIEDARYKLYFGGTLENKEIYKVIEHGDGTITFNFRDRNLADNYLVQATKTFQKVSDINDLKEGDSVIFVNEETKLAMTKKDIDGKVMASTISLNDNYTANTDANVEIFYLINSNGKYSFKTAENTYLASKKAGLGKLNSINKNSQATISITNGDATVTFGSTYKNNTISYDTNGYYFQTVEGTPAKIQIYRLIGTNGIEDIKTNQETVVKGIYNLNGQRVSEDNLQKGIYIINGKKVIIK